MKGIWMLVAALLVGTTFPLASSATTWRDYPGFFGPGHAGIVIGDFDGNGTLEAVVSGRTKHNWPLRGTHFLAVLSADSTGRLGIATASSWPIELQGPMILAPRSGSSDRLVVVASDGNHSANKILILGGLPLRVLHSIEAPLVQRVTAIADVDGDGSLDIVALASLYSLPGEYDPVILDYQTGAVKWAGNYKVSDIGVAQLDDDPALELIMASTPGRIVDGATHALELTYPSGFGTRILVGRFGNDGRTGFAIAATGSSYVQVFQSLPYSPTREFAVGWIETATVLHRGTSQSDLIAVGNSGSGGLAVYDPSTGQRLAGIENREYGVNALAVGDIDGDGRKELVFGAGGANEPNSKLRAVDLDTLSDDYEQSVETGPYSALARGDLQGGGSDQIVYTTYGLAFGNEGRRIHVLDAANGKRLRTRENAFQMGQIEAPHLAVAQLDGDAQLEIIIATEDPHPIIAVLDGKTLADQWRAGLNPVVFDGAKVQSLSIIDVNGDGTLDVVAATFATRVVILDGRNGALLWKSVTLEGSTPPSIATFHADPGAPRVAISRGTGLYVFDLANHLLTASIATADNVIGIWQWGEGAACRLGALDESAVVTIHLCTTLAIEGQRLMPEGSVFFRPLDAQANRFIAASGNHLYEVTPNGNAIKISEPLGIQLGAHNLGEVRPGADAQHFDVVVGSEYMVTRIQVGLDGIFVDSFD